jgi:hypothetical protein
MNVSYVVGLFLQLSCLHEAISVGYVLLTVPKHKSTFSQPLQLFVTIYVLCG